MKGFQYKVLDNGKVVEVKTGRIRISRRQRRQVEEKVEKLLREKILK